MFGLLLKGDKMFVALKGLMAVLNAISPLPNIIIPGLLVNELIDQRRSSILFLYIGVLVGAPVVSQLAGVVINRMLLKAGMKIRMRIETDFYSRVTRMDYDTIENPDVMLMESRAKGTLGNAMKVADRLSGLVSAGLSLIVTSSIITSLNFFIIVLVAIVIYLNSRVTKWLNGQLFDSGKELSRLERNQWGITHMMDSLFYAKEVRLFRLDSLFLSMFRDKKEETNGMTLERTKKRDHANLFYTGMNFLQQLFVYGYLIYHVLNSGLAIGAMTIYLSATAQLANSLGGVINAYLDLAGDSLAVQELMEFMEIPLRQLGTGSRIPTFGEKSLLEFRNVSFKYPGSDKYVLRNLNLTIRGNEKLCIVGANGSGKSTFIKLLTRLYWLEEGEILLDGVSIYEYDYLKYQRLFAPMFQDFALYAMPLKQNVLLANEYKRERFDEVCNQSGLSEMADRLPGRYETQITKLIDKAGVDPSGGECQRIAMARAVYHDAQIYLLDEPTAALDPISEYEIYRQFKDMIADRAAILITHRLSAVQLADRIAVFEEGQVIEEGTHKELCEKGGKYAEMFEKQAQFYRDANNGDLET